MVASRVCCSERARPSILPVQRGLAAPRGPGNWGMEQRNRTPEGEGTEKGLEGLYLSG